VDGQPRDPVHIRHGVYVYDQLTGHGDGQGDRVVEHYEEEDRPAGRVRNHQLGR
jgi:hypothetical protein